MVFGDSNIQNQVQNNNNNQANPVQNNQVTVEGPPEARPWFGDESIERNVAYILITLLITLIIYLLLRIALRIAKARRRCVRRHRKHHHHHKHRHHRRHHLSDNDNDNDNDDGPDSPHSVESLADSDLSDHSPASPALRSLDPLAENDSKLDSAAASATQPDMTDSNTMLGATDGTIAVSHDSGEGLPIKDRSSAAAAEAENFMQRRIDDQVATTHRALETGKVVTTTTTSAPSTPSLLPSCCVRLCNRIPVTLRWVFVVLVATGAIYWYWFSIVPTGGISHWLIDAQATLLHKLVDWGIPEFMHPSQIVSVVYNIWSYADYAITYSAKLKLMAAALLFPFLRWLCPCADRRPKVDSE